MKTKIAYDIDDVLLGFINPFLRFCNSNYHTSFRNRDIFSYQLEKSFGVSKEEKNRWIISFYKSDSFKHLPSLYGAKEAFELLKQNHDNIIVTSRLTYLDGINMKEITKYSLEQNFKGNYSEIFYSANHETNGKNKAGICLEQKASLMIEDCLQYALECNNLGIPVLLMNHPWNQADLKGTLITRVSGWKQALEEIKKRKI
jgi:uncharacterized HAD superfamily protein